MIATSPTTSPVAAPTKVVFPFFIVSINIQDNNAAAAEMAEVINACAARPSAFNALPDLLLDLLRSLKVQVLFQSGLLSLSVHLSVRFVTLVLDLSRKS